jgi:DNA-binding NarL/FixJ family response regulator
MTPDPMTPDPMTPDPMTPDDMTTPALRLVLADDHRMLREGLRRSLEVEGFDVVGEAADGAAAVRLAEQLRPDVLLMDVSMPVLDGVEATRLVREHAPTVPVVILTMHADQDVLVRAVRAGASGYLVKDCSTAEVVHTLRLAAAGETTLSPEFATAMLVEAQHVAEERTEPAPEPIISKREEEVLQLIAEGASTTEVAAQLFISVKTVKNHLASVYQKLDSRDRTQAVLRAVRMGIIRLN